MNRFNEMGTLHRERRKTASRFAARRSRFVRLVLAWLVGSFVSLPAAALEKSPAEEGEGDRPDKPVSYWADVRPILQTRCFRCHGPLTQEGDLRLDERKYLERGGHTGSPIVADTLKKSALYMRVTSDDKAVRMPKVGEPLTPHQRRVLAQWIQQGAVYDEKPPQESGPTPDERLRSNSNKGLLDRLADWADDTNKNVLRHVWPVVYSSLALLVLFLVIERCKSHVRSGRPWTQGRLSPLLRHLTGLHPSYYVIVMLVLVLAGFVLVHRAAVRELQDLVPEPNRHRIPAGDLATNYTHDSQTRSFRPIHPKRVGGEYYRGNDERNPELYNNGNYRTATFRLRLCDGAESAVATGDAAPRELYLRLEIERAAKATEMLFTEEIMASVYLSRQNLAKPLEGVLDDPVSLTTVQEDQLWKALYPIDVPETESSPQQRSGVIYVYRGEVKDGKIEGQPHYAVHYDLVFAGGILADESEVFMTSVLHPGTVVFLSPARFPASEWFSSQPLPEIEAANTTDPKLLGIPEHTAESQ